jgi:hypothetical protein
MPSDRNLDRRAILSNIAFALNNKPTVISSLPVAEEKGEYVGKGKDPSKDCLCHIAYFI